MHMNEPHDGGLTANCHLAVPSLRLEGRPCGQRCWESLDPPSQLRWAGTLCPERREHQRREALEWDPCGLPHLWLSPPDPSQCPSQNRPQGWLRRVGCLDMVEGVRWWGVEEVQNALDQVLHAKEATATRGWPARSAC